MAPMGTPRRGVLSSTSGATFLCPLTVLAEGLCGSPACPGKHRGLQGAGFGEETKP